jgi:hypothetical protein
MKFNCFLMMKPKKGRKMIEATDSVAIARVNEKECSHPAVESLLKIERNLAGTSSFTPYAQSCNTSFHASKSSGKRPLSVIDLIVIHATQGGTARSNAIYFSGQSAQGSTQLVVDDYTCYRCLADNEIPWGAPGANYNGFHIEQCAYSSWLRSMWSTTHRRTLLRAAYKTALHCKRYEIKTRFLTAANLRTGMRNGITTHAECTKAFGGSHTDPGTGWPQLLFMTMVKSAYVVIKVRRIA